MPLLALAVAAGVVLLAALIYWHLVLAEGAYLGARVVAWTYDWVARRYDAIKQFSPENEDWFVAGPVLRALAGVRRPLILDVGTGTGRLPAALLRNRLAAGGQVIGLDLSWKMLRQARLKLEPYGDRVRWLWHDASRLPFDDGTFDAVTCLEVLEFLPSPRQALTEMARVLAPGGVLFITNRVGAGRWLLPGRAMARPAFAGLLADLSLGEIDVRRWQVDYDLAIARRPGRADPDGHAGGGLEDTVRCPECGGALQAGVARLACPRCNRVCHVREGIVALAIAEDRGKRK